MRDYNEKYDSVQIEYAMFFMQKIVHGETEGWLTAFQDLSIEDIHDIFDEALDDFHFNTNYADCTYFQDFCDIWISNYQDKIERNEKMTNKEFSKSIWEKLDDTCSDYILWEEGKEI